MVVWKNALISVGLIAVAFYCYWNNPHIAAERAYASYNSASGEAVKSAWEAAAENGLHSRLADTAYVKAERMMTINTCIGRRFKYGATTLSQFNNLKADCMETLLLYDAGLPPL